jgi:catechol 2,3-dioxygenase-like lactoylglutathione lyase family enzyme
MPTQVVPMIHVPDVRATVEWYRGLGFEVLSTWEDDGEMSWASLAYGDTEVMFNAGGQPSAAARREVDLYARVPDVTALYERLRGSYSLVAELHDTFYGRREFIIRDINGFWITFGQALSEGP